MNETSEVSFISIKPELFTNFCKSSLSVFKTEISILTILVSLFIVWSTPRNFTVCCVVPGMVYSTSVS